MRVIYAAADDLTGQASVIDGDTLEIHGTRIRLWGVDAPESSQLCRGEDSLPYRCGAKAANDLDAFIAGRPVNCLPISLDRHGRTVATCSVGSADLGDWLVRDGLALDWPQYSKRKYDDARREAERAGRGMWAAAISSRGYIEYAFGRAEVRPIALTMPTRIHEDAVDLLGHAKVRLAANLMSIHAVAIGMELLHAV
jgi:endonuclease YncB( thermonuclease family)